MLTGFNRIYFKALSLFTEGRRGCAFQSLELVIEIRHVFKSAAGCYLRYCLRTAV
jgi:hypothetical protein